MFDLQRLLATEPLARLRNARGVDPDGRAVVYWMQRAQRVADNPAFDLAAGLANRLGLPLVVFFRLVRDFPGANARHYAFMLEGLTETAREVEKLGARFVLGRSPAESLERLCAKLRPAAVVGDENPLREPESWRQDAARRLSMAFITVDADVIIPTRLFPREEFAARTIRPKIHRLLGDFLTQPRRPQRLVTPLPRSFGPSPAPLDVRALMRCLRPDSQAAPVRAAASGPQAARRELADFVGRRLERYHERRNRPEHADGTSRLSPYLHFGQIGPREVAMAVRSAGAPPPAVEAFLEEFIVRRELCVNYVVRNAHYDSFAGLHDWARATLQRHARDRRPYIYTERQLEAAATHDPLWNAAQREMMLSGRTHGYVRMYWAKKILEWSRSPEEALEVALRLNDRWFLDGRDPNGYAGVAWAIGGKHDRPWPERPVFGTIRFMSYASTSRKFDCAGYIRRVGPPAGD